MAGGFKLLIPASGGGEIRVHKSSSVGQWTAIKMSEPIRSMRLKNNVAVSCGSFSIPDNAIIIKGHEYELTLEDSRKVEILILDKTETEAIFCGVF